ncbi:MAG: hypothetical protein FWD53_05815, partial [Phycisphaerales bacterium]|nr:hypothetical protein [Phycisphaerales bacterium]
MMLRMIAVMTLVLAMAGRGLAEKAHVLESLSDAVDKVLTVENLRAVAAKTSDAEVLLGLGYVAPAGSAARPELLARAVKLRPEYGPAAIVLEMAMEGVDEKNVATLIKADPDNALGYYLQAHQLHQAGKNAEELDAYRKGAKCAEIRLYSTMTAEALFKGLDTLGLKGRDRLAALGWTSSRMHNFYLMYVQRALSMSRLAYNNPDMAARKEISEMLLVLSGQFHQTNFQIRAFAPKAVMRAFRIKAEVAAEEKSPMMNGYVTVVQALTSMGLSWPGFAENRNVALETALFFDLRFTMAEAMGNAKIQEAHGYNAKVPEQDKAAFEKAKQELVRAAEAVVELCASDPDGIIGAYLKDLPPLKENEKGREPWVSRLSYVELLMLKRPEIFQAVAAYNDASQALQAAAENAPSKKNI